MASSYTKWRCNPSDRLSRLFHNIIVVNFLADCYIAIVEINEALCGLFESWRKMNHLISRRIKICFASMLLFFLCGVNAIAQSFQIPPDDNPFVSLEMMKPNLGEGSWQFSTISSVWFLNAQIPLGTGPFVLIADIPFSYLDGKSLESPFTSPVDFDAQILIGNPLLAVEIRSSNGPVGGFGILGVRPPLAEQDKGSAAGYGVLSDFDRFEAFTPNRFSILGGGGWRFNTGSRSRLNIGVTGMIVIPTESGPNTEGFLKYYSQLWLYFQNVSVNFGLSGVTILTEGLDLGENTESQFSLGAQFSLGSFRPGVFVRVPIEEHLSEIVDFVGGVNLTFALGG